MSSMLGLCCCLCLGFGGAAVDAVQGGLGVESSLSQGGDDFAFPTLFWGGYVSPVMFWNDSSVVGAWNMQLQLEWWWIVAVLEEMRDYDAAASLGWCLQSSCFIWRF